MRVATVLITAVCCIPGLAWADPPSLSVQILAPDDGETVDEFDNLPWIRLVLEEPTVVECRIVLNPEESNECAVDLWPQQPADKGGFRMLFGAGCWQNNNLGYLEVLKPEAGSLIGWRVINMTLGMNVHSDSGQLCATCTANGFEVNDCVSFEMDR